jgi:predicted nucleotide-binding protein
MPNFRSIILNSKRLTEAGGNALDSGTDLVLKFENFYDILVKAATNGYDQSSFRTARDKYTQLRMDILSNAKLTTKIPTFIRDCPTLDDFSKFIREKYRSSEERRSYLKSEFSAARSLVFDNPNYVNGKSIFGTSPSIDKRPQENIKNILKLRDEPMRQPKKDSIFIVHGRDEYLKEMTARFLEKLELGTIILHEKPDKGRTIIEKFEDHSSDATFAVILLTPDDVGRLASENDASLSPRARQNVIFEMGYFYGKLGRGKVCALYRGVEQPSDLHGVLYIPVDDSGAWKIHLAKELREAGLKIDLERAIG